MQLYPVKRCFAENIVQGWTSLHKELGRVKPVPPEKVQIQTLQTRKCHLALAGSGGSRASSGTHFSAETSLQTTSDVEILKVKEPVDGSCAKGVLIPKVNYALVKAALQTVPEEFADGGFWLGSYSTWGILQSGWRSWELYGNTLKKACFGSLNRSLRGPQET